MDTTDNIHLVWQEMIEIDSIGTDDDIFYEVWNKTTVTWSSITVLSPLGTEASRDTEIKADKFGNAHVIWIDKKGKFIECRK